MRLILRVEAEAPSFSRSGFLKAAAPEPVGSLRRANEPTDGSIAPSSLSPSPGQFVPGLSAPLGPFHCVLLHLLGCRLWRRT